MKLFLQIKEMIADPGFHLLRLEDSPAENIRMVAMAQNGTDEAGSAISPSRDTFISAIWMPGTAEALAEKGIFRNEMGRHWPAAALASVSGKEL